MAIKIAPAKPTFLTPMIGDKPARRTIHTSEQEAKRKPGRPKGSGAGNGKIAVTLRLPPDVVDHFKAQGPDWRARMAQILSSSPDRA
jgi:uncharacterized protein (DUF4415 family)